VEHPRRFESSATRLKETQILPVTVNVTGRAILAIETDKKMIYARKIRISNRAHSGRDFYFDTKK
jgi:hypothetical protein